MKKTTSQGRNYSAFLFALDASDMSDAGSSSEDIKIFQNSRLNGELDQLPQKEVKDAATFR